jgi:hypothetical protein
MQTKVAEKYQCPEKYNVRETNFSWMFLKGELSIGNLKSTMH